MEQELDRNDAATPYKLEQARRKGQVARSADVVSAVVFAVAVVYFYAMGWDLLVAQFRFDGELLKRIGAARGHTELLWEFVEQSLRAALTLLIPVLATVMAAILGNVLQTGPVLSAHPIQPDWNRLNPVNGFKRVFSIRTLFDAGRAMVKLVVLALVVYGALSALVPQFYQLAGRPPLAFARLLLDDIASLCLRLSLALGVIAAIDLGTCA